MLRGLACEGDTLRLIHSPIEIDAGKNISLENADSSIILFFSAGQISLSDGPLATFGEGRKYQDLFVASLRNYGMLCIGLYRHIS